MKKIITLLFISAQLSAHVPLINSKFPDRNMVKPGVYIVNNQYQAKGSANSTWIGDTDAGGRLHEAANTCRQTGNNYWPWPLDTV